MKLETFFEKLDLFADAPGAVGKIRELVLHLGFSGKLVSPEGEWMLKPLKTLATKIGSGATPAGGRESYFAKGIPFIRSMNVHFRGFEPKGLVFLSEQQASQLTNATVQSGDVLLNITGASIGRVTTAPPEMIGARVNQHVAIIRPTKELDPNFLAQFLASPEIQRMIEDVQVGATREALTKGMIEQFKTPLPPLAEQKRIVAKVDELMAMCDRLEAQLQERDARQAELARASLARFAEDPTPENLQFLFHSSFSISPADLRKTILTLAVQGKLVPQDPNDEPAEELCARIESTKQKLIKLRMIKRVTVESNPSGNGCESLPSGWLWTRLGNSFDVRDGTHDTPKYTTKGFPLVTSKNIHSGCLLFDGANLISEKDHRQISERSRVDRGDILFAMIGSIGNPVIVDTDREFSIKNVALFKYYTAADSEPRFLLLYLKLVAEAMKAKAAGGVQSFVSLGFLRNYLFPLPPLAEQRRIVAKVEELMILVDALETQIATARTTAADLLATAVAEVLVKRK
jgi:type I restriction enzyme S subunit